MNSARSRLVLFSILSLSLSLIPARAEAQETAASVKSYLLERFEKMNEASADYVKNSEDYAALVAANGGSVEAAYKDDPKKINGLVAKMQENYKAMDSFGYETVEGIVAGVP